MGTYYKPFNYYGSKTAKNIIIAMGSVTDTIKLVIDGQSAGEGLLSLLEEPWKTIDDKDQV